MITVPTESYQAATASAESESESVPCLPIVQFLSEKPGPTARLRVFYSAVKAEDAAHEHPRDAFYDAQGKLLTFTKESGSSRLYVLGKPAPGDLPRRLMEELRRAAKQAALDGKPVAGVEPLLGWLGGAPGPAHMVHALGLADADYGPHTCPACKRCTALQRLLGMAGCCPP